LRRTDEVNTMGISHGCLLLIQATLVRAGRVFPHPFGPRSASYAQRLRMSNGGLVADKTKDVLSDYLRKLGSKGGKATAKKLTPEQRKAAAQKAAKARWSKRGGTVG